MVYTVVLYHSLKKVRRAHPQLLIVLGRANSRFHSTLNGLVARGSALPMKPGLANVVISVDDSAVAVWYGRRTPTVGLRISNGQVVGVTAGIYVEFGKTRPAIQVMFTVDNTQASLSFGVQGVGPFGIRPERSMRVDSATHQIRSRLCLSPMTESGRDDS